MLEHFCTTSANCR